MRERKRRETLGGQGCDQFTNHTAPCPPSTPRGRPSSAPRSPLCGPTAMPSTTSIQNFGRASQPATLAPAAPSFFGLDNATLGGLSLLTIILFIFLPSTIFSIFVRRWAEKKAHDYVE